MTTLQVSRQFIFTPARGRKRGGINQLSGWKTACAIFLLCVATGISAPAKTFTTLVNFDGTHGGRSTNLVRGTDGNFYATSGGGVFNSGTVLKITPPGEITTLYNFCSQMNCPDGANPSGALALGTDGNFYGTTTNGGTSTACGTNGCGTVFRITPAGKLTTLYSFCSQVGCYDGAGPRGGLVQATDGNFYGTTVDGGIGGFGVVFKITPGGTLTTLHTFNGSDGESPSGSLIQATDLNFYGTTVVGGLGIRGWGTVFRMTPAGKLTTLYSFCSQTNCADGQLGAGLVQGADGNFYGTTPFGGANNQGIVFKITPAGKLTTLFSFNGQNGTGPWEALIQATDGYFYGVTSAIYPNPNGPYVWGTVFRINAAGVLENLHIFQYGDGSQPGAPLVQSTDGEFYGSTSYGGAYLFGTMFRMSVGLSPFVSFVRNSGKVGQAVQILGQGFTGATGVSFNGTPAVFAVESDTYLTTTVPAGAPSGFVTVTTPSGTLKSNKAFRVTPQILTLSPTSGPVGTSVVITGESLTRTYAITFNDAKATTFTVNSDTQVTVTVPAGAQPGKIAVLTPGGTAYSPRCFDVTP